MHLLNMENASKLKVNTMPKTPTRRPDAEGPGQARTLNLPGFPCMHALEAVHLDP
jgi:hypothetical protein